MRRDGELQCVLVLVGTMVMCVKGCTTVLATPGLYENACLLKMFVYHANLHIVKKMFVLQSIHGEISRVYGGRIDDFFSFQ